MADKHIRCEKANVVKDTNQAIDAATGDYIVHTGNDIFMKPGWLEALLECFKIPDCGAATLASSDLKHKPTNSIMEGIYGPLFMFKKGWRFDEDYENIFGDTDMIMRIYASGKRSYRNWNVVVTHLYQQTFQPMDGKQNLAERFDKFKKLFIQKHHQSNLLIFKILVDGVVI